MALFRIVNGERVDLSPQEETALREEWAAAEAVIRGPRPPMLTDVIAVLTAEQQTALATRLSEEAMP
jgi:hypothetical protein